MTKRGWGCIGLAAVLVPVLLSGCGADADPKEIVPAVDIPGARGPGAETTGDSDSTSGDDGLLEELGQWRGHWDGKQLTFTPINDLAAKSGIKPQGFIDLPDSNFEFTTELDPVAVNAGCTGTSQFYFSTPQAIGPNGSYLCENGHLCAEVTVRNLSTTRQIDKVYVQVTSITPNFFGANSVPVPTGYPLNNSFGLWSYANMPPAPVGGGTRIWDFALPTCDDFYFNAKVMGALRRTSYNALADVVDDSEWVDACDLGGAASILSGAGPGAVETGIPLPFPFTLFTTTFDGSTKIRISSDGGLGGNPANKATAAFPFGAPLKLGTAGVCYGSRGATPNRSFVVTWHDADITTTSETEHLTFSAVLYEGTDYIDFLYRRWGSDAVEVGGCASSDESQGLGTADIGVFRLSSDAYPFTEGLPQNFGDCPGDLFKIRWEARPGNASL